MDMATPTTGTLAAARPTAEQAANLVEVHGIADFIRYLLPEQIAGLGAVITALEAYAYDNLEGVNADPGFEVLYNGLTALNRLHRGLKSEIDRQFECAYHACTEAEALRTSSGLLDAATLQSIVTVASGHDGANIEDVRNAAHELRRFADADEAYLFVLRQYETALVSQGWTLRWTVSPNNQPYLELDTPKRK